jgi:hypothetical protein
MITAAIFVTFLALFIAKLVYGVQKAKKARGGKAPEEVIDWKESEESKEN